jgi:hypothetical protein
MKAEEYTFHFHSLIRHEISVEWSCEYNCEYTFTFANLQDDCKLTASMNLSGLGMGYGSKVIPEMVYMLRAAQQGRNI